MMGRLWDRARCITCGELLYGKDYRNHNTKCEQCTTFSIDQLFEIGKATS